MRISVPKFSPAFLWSSGGLVSNQGHQGFLKTLSAFRRTSAIEFPFTGFFGGQYGTEITYIKKHFLSTTTPGSGSKNKMADTDNPAASPANPAPAANKAGDKEDRSKCVFCKIADGKEQNEIYYQDDEVVVFQDIKPAAKYHFLIVTREHIRDCKSLVPSQLGLLQRMVETGEKVLLQQLQKDAPDTQNLDQIEKLLGFHWPPFHTVSHLHLHVIAPSNETGFIARAIFRPNSFWFVTPEYVKERLEKMAAADNNQG